ncbi:MAG: hypothetical protein ACK53Y_11130, partial [bacterium]
SRISRLEAKNDVSPPKKLRGEEETGQRSERQRRRRLSGVELDTAVVTSTRPSPLPPIVRHGIVMAYPPSQRQAAFVSSPNGWSPWEYHTCIGFSIFCHL